MSLWVCMGCTTRYAVDAPACPHCGAIDWTEDWRADDMPKIYADPDRPASNYLLEQAERAAAEAAGEIVTEPDAAAPAPEVAAEPTAEDTAEPAAAEVGEDAPTEDTDTTEDTDSTGTADASQPPVEVPERPGPRALKPDWVAYRVALGADPEAAEEMTKPALADDANFQADDKTEAEG